MKKTFALLLTLLALLMPLIPAQAEGPFVMMGLEVSDQEQDWNNSHFFPRMAERTGVSFTFRQYSNAADYQTALAAAFAGDDLPDVLFKAYLTPAQEMAWYESGQLVDLAPYLEEHAPNLYTILEARPEWREIITQPNGAITSLPALSGAERACCVWINRTWLEALGLSMPTTIDEYTDALRAFRDGDPNQNNKKDEVPLSIVGPWEAKFLLHAWGIVANDYNIFVDDAETVRFAPFEPEYRDFVAWLKLAQDEGLISGDTFRQTQASRTAFQNTSDSDAPLTYGGMVSLSPYSLIDLDKTMDFAVLTPLAHNGEKAFRQLLNGVGRGAFAVTTACEDIPAVLRWVDALYTEEGGRLAFAGLEGEDYTVAEDGSWQWNGGEDYYALTELVQNAVISGDSVTPGLEPAAFMRRSEIAADNYARRQLDGIRDTFVEPYPVRWPTDAAREERIATLHEALGTCVDTAIANFAMGKVELNDENWAAFEDELRALGAEEFVALWQAKYDEGK